MILFVDLLSFHVGSDCRNPSMAGEVAAEGDLIRFPNEDGESTGSPPTGLKKKSRTFQITNVVRGGDSFLSDSINGIDEELEDDGDDEGEDDSQLHEDPSSLVNHVDPTSRPSASEPVENSRSHAPFSTDRRVHPGSVFSSGGSVVSTSSVSAPSSSTTQSKFRVVRLPAHHTILNVKYNRGRWSCWDHTPDVQEPTTLPCDLDGHQVNGRSQAVSTTQAVTGDEASGGKFSVEPVTDPAPGSTTSRIGSKFSVEAVPETVESVAESSSAPTANKRAGKFTVDSIAESSSGSTTNKRGVKFAAESAAEFDVRSARGGAEKISADIRDASESATTLYASAFAGGKLAQATADQSSSRYGHVGGEEAGKDLDVFSVEMDRAAAKRLDTMLKTVSDTLRQYNVDEQQHRFNALMQNNRKLILRVNELQQNKGQLTRELERLKADNQRLSDENSLLVRTLSKQRRTN